MANRTILHKRNTELVDGQPKAPSADSMRQGEIALNLAAGNETMYVKNSEDEIVAMPINGIAQTVSDALAMHEARNDNPHGVTKKQVGLGNVDNTADADKPVSEAQQAELDKKLNNAANGGIANNLTTNSSTVALSAAQGVALQAKLDEVTEGGAADLQELEERVSAVEEEINTSSSYINGTLLPLAKRIHTELTV